MNYSDYQKNNAARRAAAAAKATNRSTGRASEQKSLSSQLVTTGLTTLKAACSADADLALQVRAEALSALHKGDIPLYVEKRSLLPRRMAQAI